MFGGKAVIVKVPSQCCAGATTLFVSTLFVSTDHADAAVFSRSANQETIEIVFNATQRFCLDHVRLFGESS